MLESEFAELLQHLVRSARASGLGEVSDRVLSDIRIDPGRPSDQVLSYLDALMAELRLGNDSTIRQVVTSINEVARTESGRRIDGLRVELTEGDRAVYGIDHVDLGIAPNLSDIIDQLDQLRRDLVESREG